MKLPNKFVNYKESVLSRFSPILEQLQKEDMTVIRLFSKIKGKVKNATEFIQILDCLYALGKIEKKGELISYVDRN